MSFLLGIIIGLVVGWNIPQPTFAKNLQSKVKKFFADRTKS